MQFVIPDFVSPDWPGGVFPGMCEEVGLCVVHREAQFALKLPEMVSQQVGVLRRSRCTDQSYL